jgi:hypothetical protein
MVTCHQPHSPEGRALGQSMSTHLFSNVDLALWEGTLLGVGDKNGQKKRSCSLGADRRDSSQVGNLTILWVQSRKPLRRT